MGGVRGEKNISTKGKKEKASARFPQQSFYAGRETRYKEKTGQRQEEIDGLKKKCGKKRRYYVGAGSFSRYLLKENLPQVSCWYCIACRIAFVATGPAL
ncbi:MAG: hypothetical protein DDT21_00845 [Syntrophomonadaceae bacterium]|nr:hypothetical protein [Bacillota bacterium]